MSGPSRMDMFRLAGRTVDTALQAWGVSQEQRRTAEFNKATADAREGYRQLLQDIEKENDYTQHEVMFNRGVSEIRKTVGDQWLGDPYVRTRFDAQWSGMTQAARGTAMNYSWAAEKSALQVEMFGQIKDFYQSSLENAYTNTRGVLNEYYEAGIIDDRVREEAWQYYRQQGQHALKARVDAAVEARDPERVEQLYAAATEGSIIEDPELAANMKAADLYAIRVGVTTDTAIGVYAELGIEAAVGWITNLDNLKDLDAEDQIRVQRTVMEHVGLRRSEETLTARKLDEAYMGTSVDIESSAEQGNSTWGEAIAWLHEEETKDALHPNNWRTLLTRWTHQDDLANMPAGGGAPTKQELRDQEFSIIIGMLKSDPAPSWAEVEQYAHDLLGEVFTISDYDRVTDMNSPEGRAAFTEYSSYIRTLINDEVATQKAAGTGLDISSHRVDRLEARLFQNVRTLKFGPDGTEYPRDVQEANIRSAITTWLRGTPLEEPVLFWSRDMTNAEMTQAAMERRLFGVFNEDTMTEAVTALATKSEEERDAYLRNLVHTDIPDHQLSPLEVNEREAFAAAAKLNEDSLKQFIIDFQVQPHETGMTANGLLTFSRIETVNGKTGPIYYQRQVHNGEYQWRRYSRSDGSDVWSRFDPIKERADAAADKARLDALAASRVAGVERVEHETGGAISSRALKAGLETRYRDIILESSPGGGEPNEPAYLQRLMLAEGMEAAYEQIRGLPLDAPGKAEDMRLWNRVNQTLLRPGALLRDEDLTAIGRLIEFHAPGVVGEWSSAGGARTPREEEQTTGVPGFEITPAGELR